jgi:hypothetical protein
MTDKTDYRDLLARYIAHVRRLNRGRDLLDDCMAFAPAEIRELRQLVVGGPSNPTDSYPERVGGNTPGDRPWFTESLKGL